MRQLRIVKQITNRETQSLDKYLQEIGRLDLVDADAEASLAKRVRDGDPAALQKLVLANLRFVVSVAKQYQNYGMSLGDLINEGNLGLIKAARRFDETRGFKFISYAVWWIRQGIMQGLADHSRLVRIPLNRVSAVNKMLRTVSELEQTHQREPSMEEIAAAVGTTQIDISYSHTQSKHHLSIHAPIADGEDQSLLDTVEDTKAEQPDAMLINDSLKTEVRRALSTLSRREAEVMSLFFGLDGGAPMTLAEIGERFQLTRERVRQIKEKATRRLANQGRSELLRSYL